MKAHAFYVFAGVGDEDVGHTIPLCYQVDMIGIVTSSRGRVRSGPARLVECQCFCRDTHQWLTRLPDCFRLAFPNDYYFTGTAFSTLRKGSPRSVSISMMPVSRNGLVELIDIFAWR